MPHLAEEFSSKDPRGLVEATLKLAGFAGCMGAVSLIGAAAFGRAILAFLYGPEYAHEGGLFTWIVGAGASSYIAGILGYSILATRRFRVQVPIHLCVVVNYE